MTQLSARAAFAARMGYGNNEAPTKEVETFVQTLDDFNLTEQCERIRLFRNSIDLANTEITQRNALLLKVAKPLLSFEGAEHFPITELIRMYNGLDIELLASQELVCPWIVSICGHKVFFSCSLVLCIAISKALHGVTMD